MTAHVPTWATPNARSLAAAMALHRERTRREARDCFWHRREPLNANRLAELRAEMQEGRQ